MDPYERFILFVWFYFGKMWKFSEKRPFFRADMAGLGIYHMGGYGRIGVYRVKQTVLKLFRVARHLQALEESIYLSKLYPRRIVKIREV